MTENYAIDVVNSSYAWYVTASTRSRRAYRHSETATVVISAAIPLAAVLCPRAVWLPALLGSCLVVLAGIRAMFNWQENYLRFSQAREAVEAVRRDFHTWSPPYDQAETRERRLIEAVTRIERDEMRQWTSLARSRRPSDDDRRLDSGALLDR
jgi:hypothetical protein